VAPRTIAARFLTARPFAVDRSVPGRRVMRRCPVMDRMVLVPGGATLRSQIKAEAEEMLCTTGGLGAYPQLDSGSPEYCGVHSRKLPVIAPTPLDGRVPDGG